MVVTCSLPFEHAPYIYIILQLTLDILVCCGVQIVGIGSEEQLDVFKVVAAVLHLGNVEFVEASEPDSSKISSNKSEVHLAAVAKLLGVDVEALRKALTTRTRETFGMTNVIPAPIPLLIDHDICLSYLQMVA